MATRKVKRMADGGFTTDEAGNRLFVSRPAPAPVAAPAPAARRLSRRELKRQMRDKIHSLDRGTQDYQSQRQGIRSEYKPLIEEARAYERANPAVSSASPRPTAQMQGMGKGAPMRVMKAGGSVKSSAATRGDGIAQRGKTRGRFV